MFHVLWLIDHQKNKNQEQISFRRTQADPQKRAIFTWQIWKYIQLLIQIQVWEEWLRQVWND